MLNIFKTQVKAYVTGIAKWIFGIPMNQDIRQTLIIWIYFTMGFGTLKINIWTGLSTGAHEKLASEKQEKIKYNL